MNKSTLLPTVFAVLLLSTFGMLPTSTAAPGWSLAFEEEFDGTSLNPMVWNANPHTGSISVAGGAATLQGNVHFPFATTTASPQSLYQPGGHFRTTVDFQYLNYNIHGAGVLGQYPEHIWSIWQDSSRVRGTEIAMAIDGHWHIHIAPPNQRYTAEFSWDGATYQAKLNGLVVISVPSTTPPPGGHLLIGNPTECCPSASYTWNHLKLYSIRSEAVSPDPTQPVPELTTGVLLAAGLVGTIAVVAVRRK